MVAPGDKDFEERLVSSVFDCKATRCASYTKSTANRMAVTGSHTTATVTVATGLMCWVKRPIANSLEETMKKVGDVQASLCCPRMLIVSFAAALFGSADVRAEQPATTQTGHWSAEKILPPEPGRKACWHRVYDAKHLRRAPAAEGH